MLHGIGVIPWADTEWSRHTLRSSVNGDGYGTGYWLGDRVTEVLTFWDNKTQQLNGDYLITAINNHYENNGSANKSFRSIMDLYRPYCASDSLKTRFIVC